MEVTGAQVPARAGRRGGAQRKSGAPPCVRESGKCTPEGVRAEVSLCHRLRDSTGSRVPAPPLSRNPGKPESTPRQLGVSQRTPERP